MAKPYEEKTHNLPRTKGLRKALRKDLTPAEAALWRILKNSKLEGRKFRRQHSVGRYILDFYCPDERLAIELDGNVHFSDAAQDKDAERTNYLIQQGIRVIRFENKWVFEDIDFVLRRIESHFGWWKNT